eukprot:snap_masked-scaffold_9-processed-gene-3.27-mRNA-1 protein AED:1.00 eAED:1.00 QI:0/-1/0/0/-1/1/1/0/2957
MGRKTPLGIRLRLYFIPIVLVAYPIITFGYVQSPEKQIPKYKLPGTSLGFKHFERKMHPIAEALKHRKRYEEKFGPLNTVKHGKGIRSKKTTSSERKRLYISRTEKQHEDEVFERDYYLRGNSSENETESIYPREGCLIEEDKCQFYDQCYPWDDPEECNREKIDCRDCAGPMERCEGVTECADELRHCIYIESENLTHLPAHHPCRSSYCEVSTVSGECLNEIFDYCCDPSLDGCDPPSEVLAVRENYPCTPFGCSRFIDEFDNRYEDQDMDFKNIRCPFSNVSVCEVSCNLQFFQVHESFVVKSCDGPHCLHEYFRRYIPPHMVLPELPDTMAQIDGYAGEYEYLQPNISLPTYVCSNNPFFDDSMDFRPGCHVEPNQYIVNLFSTVEVEPGVTVLSCFKTQVASNSNGILNCRGLLLCMDYIMTLMGDQQNVICFGDVTGCGEYSSNLGITEEDYSYIRNVYSKYLQCNGERPPDVDDSNWNYNGACNQTKDGCGDQCCSVIAKLRNGEHDFGRPDDSSVFVCGQLEDPEDVSLCMQQACQSCFPLGSGPFGPDVFRENRLARGVCLAAIHNHCLENSTDAPCQASCFLNNCDSRKYNCPCDDLNCMKTLGASYNERSKCEIVRDALVKEFVKQGFLQPESEWLKDFLIERNAYIQAPPEGKGFVPTQYILDLVSATGCEHLGELTACLAKAVPFCNGERNFWSPQCNKLSVCGDGVVSWGEECDDGNVNQFQDGCENCRYVEHEYICRAPGLPCERCILDDRGEEEGRCPFCLNKRVANFTSPCLASECRALKNYNSALACDMLVLEYCGEIEIQGLYDPGCRDYKPKADKFLVPRIIDGCSFDIKKLELFNEKLRGLKVALFECELTDIYGVNKNLTPMVPYSSMKSEISEEDYDMLDPLVQIELDLLDKFPKDELVPITKLTSHEFDFETNVRLTENNRPLEEHNPLSRIATILWDPSEKREDNEDWSDCSYPNGDRLEVLTPCEDLMAEAAQRLLLKSNFFANIYGSYEFEDLKEMDFEEPLVDCIPKEGTIQFMVHLSTYLVRWVGNGEAVVEEPVRHCTGEHHHWEACPTKEELLSGGNATLHFGTKLFDSKCEDKECDLEIEKCSYISLKKAVPHTDLTSYQNATKLLQDLVNELGSSTDWDEMAYRLTRIAQISSSDSIQDALSLYSRLVVEGQVPKVRREVENYCPYDHWIYNTSSNQWEENEVWATDPCCNWEIREYLCCAPRDVPNGFISVVTGFDESEMATRCHNPAKVKNIAQDMKQKYEQANKLQAQIAEWTNMDDFEKIWEFEESCREEIGNGEECTTDADCSCTYSKCKSKYGTSRCETDERDMFRCFAQCFENEYSESNPTLMGFLYEHWGIKGSTADTSYQFEEAWGDRMTENGCAGPESWRSDIGYGRYEYSCDLDCTAAYTCDLEGASRQVALEKGIPEHEYWEIRTDSALCSKYGGNHTCSYVAFQHEACHDFHCLFPETENFSMPCHEQEQCYMKCEKLINDFDSCVTRNGTWMEQENSCCPSPGYIHNQTYGQECKYFPVGTPYGGDIRDQTCCLAAGGKFLRNRWGGGDCCFGVFREHCHGKECYQYCENNLNIWEEAESCYEGCHELGQECRSCWEEREDCCGTSYVPPNKTACLSYMGCNDRTISDPALCTDSADEMANTGWCGEFGYPVSDDARCTIHPEWGSTCEDNGGETRFYEWGGSYCSKANFSAVGSVEDCFPNVCYVPAWDERYPSIEEPEHGVFGWFGCESGCYLESNFSVFFTEEYSWGTHCYAYDSMGDYYGGRFLEERCIVWNRDSLVCSDLNGTLVLAYYDYNPPRYNTKEQCEAGYCEGSINHGGRDPITEEWFGSQPWSKEQCLDLSGISCTRHCPSCGPQNWPMSERGGGCFNITTETLLTDYSELMCIDNTTDTLRWFSCPIPANPNLEYPDMLNFCSDMLHTNASNYTSSLYYKFKDLGETNIPVGIFSQLSCGPDYAKCATPSLCESVGDCEGSRYGWIQLYTEVCTEPGWAHGNRFWGYKINEVLDEDTGTISYNSEYESCSYQYHTILPGICVAPRVAGRCENFMWHSLGCKTNGLHSEVECLFQNYTWYNKPMDKSSCEAIKGCKIDWNVRQLPSEECTKCGGEPVSYMKWRGGKVVKAFVNEYQWHENRSFGPVNEWIKTQASWKILEELNTPILRTFIQLKQLELNTKFNLYAKALEALVCDCGDTFPENIDCFEAISAASITGNISSFASCDPTEEFGPGEKIEVSGNCPDEDTRLLTSLLESNDTEVNVTETLELQFTYISAAGQDVHEPCQNNDSLLVDTLVVKNPHTEVFIGQLIGDGVGISAVGDLSSIAICLNAREDIKLYSELFSYYGLAERSGDSYYALYLDEAAFSSKGASKVCARITSVGEFFPYIGLSVNESNAFLNLSAALELFERELIFHEGFFSTLEDCNGCSSHGKCTQNLNGTYSCICQCGFSGSHCESGCHSYCSSSGKCTETGCECDTDSNGYPLYTGNDCSQINCPLNNETGIACSGRGNCVLNSSINSVSCNCLSEYYGTTCELLNISGIVGADIVDDSGYGDVDSSDIEDLETQSIFFAPTPGPSTGPTFAPTWAPSAAPKSEPVATLSIPLGTDLDVTQNSSVIFESLQDGVETALNLDSNLVSEGTFEVEVTVNIEESCALTLSAEPSAAEVLVLTEATRIVRCGRDTSLAVCSIVFGSEIDNSSSFRFLLAYVAEFTVFESLSKEVLEERDALPSESKPVSLTSSNFETLLADAVIETAVSTGTEYNETSFTVAAPQKATEAVVEVKFLANEDADISTASTLVSDIQTATQNTTNIQNSIEEVSTTSGVSLSMGTIEVDLCEGRLCSDHGTCSEGECDCEAAYYGVNCEKRYTPAPSDSPTENPTTNPTRSPIGSPTQAPIELNTHSSPTSSPVQIPTSTGYHHKILVCLPTTILVINWLL